MKKMIKLVLALLILLAMSGIAYGMIGHACDAAGDGDEYCDGNRLNPCMSERCDMDPSGGICVADECQVGIDCPVNAYPGSDPYCYISRCYDYGGTDGCKCGEVFEDLPCNDCLKCSGDEGTGQQLKVYCDRINVCAPLSATCVEDKYPNSPVEGRPGDWWKKCIPATITTSTTTSTSSSTTTTTDPNCPGGACKASCDEGEVPYFPHTCPSPQICCTPESPPLEPICEDTGGICKVECILGIEWEDGTIESCPPDKPKCCKSALPPTTTTSSTTSTTMEYFSCESHLALIGKQKCGPGDGCYYPVCPVGCDGVPLESGCGLHWDGEPRLCCWLEGGPTGPEFSSYAGIIGIIAVVGIAFLLIRKKK